ncbi:ankyrin, partial [Massarina eburnea CBS 473.64]
MSRFLLAQLYLDSLLDKRTKNKVHAALANLSTGSEAINEAYDEAIRRIKSQLPEDAALAHRILTWLVYARQNLTTAELLDALAVKPGTSKIDPDDLEDIKSVISVCAGLVAVDEKSNIVRLVHYTTQEYFEGIKNEWNPNAQLEITTACLAYLSFEAFREGACNTEEDWCTRKYDHSFLEYAGRFWGEHAISVQHEVTEMVLLLLQHDGITSSIMQAFDKAGKQFWKDLTYLAPKRQITAIHLGALFGLDHIVEQVLYRSEQDPKLAVNTKDSDNLTPLHFAVDGNNLDMVRILHRHGVDLDARGRFEATAVSIAIENGYVQMVDLLLRLGAD